MMVQGAPADARFPQDRIDRRLFIAPIGALDADQLIAIEPELRKLEVPTLAVWGTGDQIFDAELAYWLRDNVPGCREVVEVPGGKLFWPGERPDDLVGTEIDEGGSRIWASQSDRFAVLGVLRIQEVELPEHVLAHVSEHEPLTA
jgi:pimeloyl-ACP methyl ester carboxylesterase